MSIFLNEDERSRINTGKADKNCSNLYWGLLNRVKSYSEAPGLSNGATNTEWWHHAAEYLTDSALVCAITDDARLKNWLRGAALEIARRPIEDWIGPFFRDHTVQPPCGHLETTHLAIAIAVTLDLVPEIFTADELEELRSVLREKAIPLCREWLKNNTHLANWHCILLAGLAVPAAVLDDAGAIEEAAAEYEFCLNAVQPDGTYGESLQYSNYCYYGLMMTYEALTRRRPELRGRLSIEKYGRGVKWFIHSLMYQKPLSGWGACPRPRSLNFNDSAALFGAAPDLLMHISYHLKDSLPEEAGLARWLFDELYSKYPAQGPFDRSTFGFINRYGFLSLIYYPAAAAGISPEKMPLSVEFSNGHCIVRNRWQEPETILGFSGSAAALNATGHQHGDLNSFILAHRNERMLVDPGHTCYRNLIHQFDCATGCHNTCTFIKDGTLLEQRHGDRRIIGTGKTLSSPVKRPGQMLIASRLDDITVFGNDAGEAYGEAIRKFERFVILAGEHAIFVVDRIESTEPVRTAWNWALNNRDGELDFKLVYPDRLVVRRGNAGMKIFHLGKNAKLSGPSYAYVHDAYHPLPNRPGEGAPGSGILLKWSETVPVTSRTVIHAIALDEYGISSGWHLRKESDLHCSLEGPGKKYNWQIQVEENRFKLLETTSRRGYSVEFKNEKWFLDKPL